MGISAAVIAGATAFTAYQSYTQGQDARKRAEEQAAQQREALAKLQSESTPAIPVADEVAKKARRDSIVAQMQRRGRASTILSNPGAGDTLGGS